MYQIIKDHHTNRLIATLPQIRVERGSFLSINHRQCTQSNRRGTMQKNAGKLWGCCQSVGCPFSASARKPSTGWQLNLYTPGEEDSSYLGIKAGVLVGITDVHGKACGGHELRNAIIYQPVGVWWLLHAFFETIRTPRQAVRKERNISLLESKPYKTTLKAWLYPHYKGINDISHRTIAGQLLESTSKRLTCYNVKWSNDRFSMIQRAPLECI